MNTKELSYKGQNHVIAVGDVSQPSCYYKKWADGGWQDNGGLASLSAHSLEKKRVINVAFTHLMFKKC